MARSLPLRASLAALAAATASALNNGLARTPPMGYNTWFLNQAGNDAQLRATADAMLAGGFLAAGYDTITIDDLWSNGRDANGDWVPIASLFPNGTQAVLEYMRGLGFTVGQYTGRGTTFCGGPTGTGSQGFEAHDATLAARAPGLDPLAHPHFFLRQQLVGLGLRDALDFHELLLRRVRHLLPPQQTFYRDADP